MKNLKGTHLQWQEQQEKIKKVYVLVKLLKWLTGSAVNTYHCKYAWDDVLAKRHSERLTEISEREIGLLLYEVIQHRSIRNKFNSVHPDLKAEGVTRVVFDDQGILDSGVWTFFAVCLCSPWI